MFRHDSERFEDSVWWSNSVKISHDISHDWLTFSERFSCHNLRDDERENVYCFNGNGHMIVSINGQTWAQYPNSDQLRRIITATWVGVISRGLRGLNYIRKPKFLSLAEFVGARPNSADSIHKTIAFGRHMPPRISAGPGLNHRQLITTRYLSSPAWWAWRTSAWWRSSAC